MEKSGKILLSGVHHRSEIDEFVVAGLKGSYNHSSLPNENDFCDSRP